MPLDLSPKRSPRSPDIVYQNWKSKPVIIPKALRILDSEEEGSGSATSGSKARVTSHTPLDAKMT